MFAVNIGRFYDNSNTYPDIFLSGLEILHGQSTDGPAIYSHNTTANLRSYSNEMSITMDLGFLVVAYTYYTIKMAASCNEFSYFYVTSTSGRKIINGVTFSFKSPIMESSGPQLYVGSEGLSSVSKNSQRLANFRNFRPKSVDSAY